MNLLEEFLRVEDLVMDLHQALEAKEKIDIQAENQTLASITYQNYFKLYKKICGCTGTAAVTESAEFFEIYNPSRCSYSNK